VGGDTFHTFSHVSGQKKEVVNQICGVGTGERAWAAGPGLRGRPQILRAENTFFF